MARGCARKVVSWASGRAAGPFGGGVCRSTEPLWSKYGMRIAHGKGTSHRQLNATQIVGALALGFVETSWVAVLLELPNDIVGNGVALRFGELLLQAADHVAKVATRTRRRTLGLHHGSCGQQEQNRNDSRAPQHPDLLAPNSGLLPASLGLYYGAFPDRPALTGLSGEMQPVGFPGPTAAYPEAGGTSPKGRARNPNRASPFGVPP